MEKRWIDQHEITNRKSLPGQMTGGMIAIYVKKFEILQNETVNSTTLSDCLPIIMDLITCELKLDKILRQSLFQSLVQMVVSSETVVQKLSDLWKRDGLMRDLLRVMREHVMTQYKYYQLYMHNMVTVIKCLARLMKNNKAKEIQFIKTTYLVSKDRCTMLDVLFKPIHYLINMNKMFNDLSCMLLNNEDINYISEIKRYLTQVFNKIQNKLDVMSEIIDDILKRYENRRKKRKLTDDKWRKIKQKLNHIFEISIVKPCLFTLNLYLNYYFPTDEQMKEYLNNLI